MANCVTDPVGGGVQPTPANGAVSSFGVEPSAGFTALLVHSAPSFGAQQGQSVPSVAATSQLVGVSTVRAISHSGHGWLCQAHNSGPPGPQGSRTQSHVPQHRAPVGVWHSRPTSRCGRGSQRRECDFHVVSGSGCGCTRTAPDGIPAGCSGFTFGNSSQRGQLRSNGSMEYPQGEQSMSNHFPAV